MTFFSALYVFGKMFFFVILPIIFFASIRPFPKKKLVLSLFSKNLQKRHFFRNVCFPLTGFFAWEFSWFLKKTLKKCLFLPSTPRRHYFSVFLWFYCIILIGADLTTKYFIGKNRLFSNFCPFWPCRHDVVVIWPDI